MKIRKAKKQDIDACSYVYENWSAQERKITKNDLTRQIKDNRHLVLVAEINNKIVGFITADKQAWNNSFYIERLFVEKEQRSKGYGSKLLLTVINRAKQSKARIVFVDLTPQNKGAMRFYLRNGFQKAGQIKEFFDDPEKPNAVILSYKV
jgi:ribosomal protein S18 acetylase RimI-like enzyme